MSKQYALLAVLAGVALMGQSCFATMNEPEQPDNTTGGLEGTLKVDTGAKSEY